MTGPEASDAQEAGQAILRQRAESLARESVEESTEELSTFLQFRTDAEWYALEIGDVREIVQDYVVAPLPCVPRFVAGVLNLRGEIISVCDAGLLMNASGTSTSAVRAGLPAIVVSRNGVATTLLVDEVGDIVEVGSQDLEPPLATGGHSQSEFVSAVTEIDGRLVAIVRTERVLEPVTTGTRH